MIWFSLPGKRGFVCDLVIRPSDWARPSPTEAEAVSPRMLWWLVPGMVVVWLPALLGHEAVAQVSGLYRLGAAPYPYMQPSHAGLLYVVGPVVVASSFLLYLSPGGILVLAFGQARSAAEWVVLAFGSSIVLSVLLSSGAKLALGTPLTAPALLSLWLGTSALGWLLLALRLRRKVCVSRPMIQWPEVRCVLWMLAAFLVGVAALAPKIFWENFNLDGIEAFEFGRSLATHFLPYWEIQDGVFGFYHNFLLFAFPNHWFTTLFGPFEASARLPFLLYLGVLFAGLILLIEQGSVRRLSGIEEAALWFGLLLYTVVQAYNTNYEPFFNDLAEPAAPDSLLVVCFVSACHALWARRLVWLWIFALMTYFAAPGGLLLLGALAVATFLTKSPGRREHLKTLGGIILVCFLIGLAYEGLYSPLGLGGVNNQFSAQNMLRRLYPPTLTEFVRLNALVFPSGVLPALALFLVWRQDCRAAMLAWVTVGYFALLYVQVWTSLHQFTPVMVLPLVVFWRIYLGSSLRAQPWLLAAVATATALSLVLSLPRHFQINQAIREFGLATLYRFGDYEGSYEQAVRGGRSLNALLPKDYRLRYPEQPWGADPASWIYYATREKPPGTTVNYVLQAVSEPPPSNATLLTVQDGVSVYVRDLEVWRRDRERELPRVVQSPLYEPIYRHTYQFFRAYSEWMQRKALEEGSKRN